MNNKRTEKYGNKTVSSTENSTIPEIPFSKLPDDDFQIDFYQIFRCDYSSTLNELISSLFQLLHIVNHFDFVVSSKRKYLRGYEST